MRITYTKVFLIGLDLKGMCYTIFKVAKSYMLNKKGGMRHLFYLGYNLALIFFPSSSNPGLSSSANIFAL
jgi:hypothetical protein